MRDLSHAKVKFRSGFFTPFRLNMGLLFLLLALSLTYVFSVNSIATANYQIKKISNQLSNLDAQHNDLELKNSTLQSVTTIQAETSQLDFVPTTSMTYLRDDSFALK